VKKVLIIDDESGVIHVIQELLTDMEHEVSSFTDPEEGEAAALENEYDLMIIDIRMPKKNGAEITENILKQKPRAKILINTGYPDDPAVQRALDAGASGLLLKPFEIEKIIDFLKET